MVVRRSGDSSAIVHNGFFHKPIVTSINNSRFLRLLLKDLSSIQSLILPKTSAHCWKTDFRQKIWNGLTDESITLSQSFLGTRICFYHSVDWSFLADDLINRIAISNSRPPISNGRFFWQGVTFSLVNLICERFLYCWWLSLSSHIRKMSLTWSRSERMSK